VGAIVAKSRWSMNVVRLWLSVMLEDGRCAKMVREARNEVLKMSVCVCFEKSVT
jgi:hypothetical protein